MLPSKACGFSRRCNQCSCSYVSFDDSLSYRLGLPKRFSQPCRQGQHQCSLQVWKIKNTRRWAESQVRTTMPRTRGFVQRQRCTTSGSNSSSSSNGGGREQFQNVYLQVIHKVRGSLAGGGDAKRERGQVNEVPWDLKKIVQVITMWLVGFCLVGGVGIPIITQWFGFHTQSLVETAHWKQAFFTVTVDIIEMCVGLGVLKACIGHYRPLEKGLFPMRWKGKWPLVVLLACTCFPVVQYIANASEGIQATQQSFRASWDWIPQEIMQMSPIELIAQSTYIFWTTCMSPIWEEILFRGFLIPSFCRYLPTIASVTLSAVIFALLHFSMQRLLPLTLLGILMGIVFTRTNNLLASMALHSLWNVFAFISAFTFPISS